MTASRESRPARPGVDLGRLGQRRASAHDLARLSELAYARPLELQRGLDRARLRLIKSFAHNDTEALLVASPDWTRPDWMALAFRGTEARRLHPRDIFSNAGLPVPWAGRGRVHFGYERHLNQVRHSARELAEDVSPDLPLYVTGHSLGGAVASLFAAWWYGERAFRDQEYKLAGLVTFGAPKAMDAEAGRAIACPIARYVVQRDFAQWWPPSVILKHPAPAIALTPAAWWPPDPLSRHDAGGYVAALAAREAES